MKPNRSLLVAASLLTLALPSPILGQDRAVDFFRRAQDAYARREWDNALSNYDRTIQLAPKYPDAYIGRGNARRMKNDLSGALADYDEALRLKPGAITWHGNPDLSEAYDSRAKQKERKDDLDGALADYSRAIEISPHTNYYYMHRADVKWEKGDLMGALTDYNKVIRVTSNWVGAFSRRGAVKEEMGEMEAALADYRRALELSGGFENIATCQIWIVQTRQGNKAAADEQARAWLEQASTALARSNGTDTNYIFEVSLWNFLLGQTSESEALATSAPGEKPWPPLQAALCYYIGMKRLFAGDYDAASSYLRKCVSLTDRHDLQYQIALGELRSLKKRANSRPSPAP